VTTQARFSTRFAATLCLCAALAGCASTPPPKLQELLLSAPATESISADAQSLRPQLVLRGVTVPDYLDRRALVYRDGLRSLAEYPGAEWGERPSKGITRWLAAALAQAHPSWQVLPFSSADGRLPKGLLTVHLQQAEPDAKAGLLQLRGEWSLSISGKTVASGQIQSSAPLGAATAEASVAALEAALSTALAQIRIPDATLLPPSPP